MQKVELTPEELQAALASNESELQANDPQQAIVESLIKIIDFATSDPDTPVYNMYRVDDGEIRCIVLNDGIIKPTVIDKEAGTSTQLFDERGGDVSIWIAIIANMRFLMVKDTNGLRQLSIEELNPLFKEKAAYAQSFLGSFNSNNNVLLDDSKVETYENVTAYIDAEFGKVSQDIKEHLTTLLINNDDWEECVQRWDDAKVLTEEDLEDAEIEWGLEVELEDETFGAAINAVYLVWILPTVETVDGISDELPPSEFAHVVLRRYNPQNIPQMAANSTGRMMFTEPLNTQVVAYARIVEDVLNYRIVDVELFKTADFDVNKTSF